MSQCWEQTCWSCTWGMCRAALARILGPVCRMCVLGRIPCPHFPRAANASAAASRNILTLKVEYRAKWGDCGAHKQRHGLHKTLPHHPLFVITTAEEITFPFDLWDDTRKLGGSNLCWFGSQFVLPFPVLGLKDFLSQPATNTHERGGVHPLSLLFSLIFLFVFQVLPSQRSPRGSGLFPLHYKVNRKESSLWLLVSICSWCPWYWQPPVCVPDDYCSEGPFSKGEALLGTKIV